MQALRETINKHQETTDVEIQLSTAIEGTTSAWVEVSKAVRLAKSREKYDDHDTGKIKRYCGTIVENLPAFEGWLNLLPDGDYGAIVCGVFSMAVGVRQSDARPIKL